MTTEEKKKQLINEKNHDFNSLRMLTEVLRGKGGCPWDMEQTHESIRNDIIEETYEGDVLFQVMFHSRIEEEAGRFSVDDVINEVCEKMISRHPHVFGDVKVSGSGEVLDNWETIKKAEKDRKTVKESMQSVPKQLPSLMRTRKIVKKAKKDGFDFAVTENDIISLAEKLKTAQGDEREELITDIVFASVVLSDGADIEKHLGEKTDEFINDYKDKGVNNET